ncbi:MAG TPA: hypothetical protein VH143_33825 [Kofleriaceae bacterium]|jgi:hypothetical protein|nr:hypothetical protein [Kofleriaceae bacterium]
MRCAAILLALVGTASASTPWIDAPAWPAKASAAELTWLVSSVVVVGSDDMPRQAVELVVAIGGVERHVKLHSQFGQMVPSYQSVCGGAAFPLKHGELAQINFEEGGFGGFVVRRAADDVLEVVEWTQEDGACEVHGKTTACPRNDKLVATMHVPAGVNARERLFDVDAHGKRTAFACKS